MWKASTFISTIPDSDDDDDDNAIKLQEMPYIMDLYMMLSIVTKP